MADAMKVAASATWTTTASGTTDPFGPEAQRKRDTALATSLCGCGHKRILHYSGDVMKRDWRGATGPCRDFHPAKAKFRRRQACECQEFRAGVTTVLSDSGAKE